MNLSNAFKPIKTVRFVSIIILFAIIGGCSASNVQKNIYHNNKNIVSEADSYTFKSKKGNTDEQSSKLSIEGFTGAYTLWFLENKGTKEEITLTYELETKQGNCKLVYIDSDNKVQELVEQDGSKTIQLPVITGKGRIKMVGINAKAQVDIKLHATDKVKVSTQ